MHVCPKCRAGILPVAFDPQTWPFYCPVKDKSLLARDRRELEATFLDVWYSRSLVTAYHFFVEVAKDNFQSYDDFVAACSSRDIFHSVYSKALRNFIFVLHRWY